MRTLLTGFGPFRDVVDNPTARIVGHFAAAGAPGHELTTRVLPVSFAEAGEQVRALLLAEPYDVALLLGVARGESAIRFECIGRCCDPATTKEAPPAAHGATLTPDSLAEWLEGNGFPSRLSEDAGGYVCDHTFFSALDAISGGGLATRCLFIHMPADDQTFAAPPAVPTMPLARQIEAMAQVLAWLKENPT